MNRLRLTGPLPLASWPACSAVLLLAACASDSSPGQRGASGERFDNGHAFVVESAIHASRSGDDLRVEVPLAQRSLTVLTGEISVDVIDLSDAEEPTLATGTLQFSQRALQSVHEVTIPAAIADMVRADTIHRVLRWRVELGEGALFGRRSLYGALGSLELQVRAATEVEVGGNTSVRVIVRDPSTGAPVQDATVEAILTVGSDTDEQQIVMFTGQTDELGELLGDAQFPGDQEQGTLRVTATHGTAQVWSESSLRSAASQKLHLSTDKTIYKPGQTIRLRTLALDGLTRLPVALQSVLFEAIDGKGNKVYKRAVTTDDFGVASVAVPTDSRINEGDWTFRATLAGARQEVKRPVAAYTLPKMRLELQTDTSWVQVGDVVSGSINATYLFGEPVVAAAVEIVVNNSQGTALVTIETETDASGHGVFSATLPGTAAPDEKGDSLHIIASLVDTAGQSEDTSMTLPFARGALIVDAAPSQGVLVRGQPNSIFVLVSDPSGRPVVADLRVSGLAMPATATDADGIAEISLSAALSEQATISITATDGAGRTYTRDVSLPLAATTALIVSPDRPIYKVGDTTQVDVQVPTGITRVWVNVFKAGALVHTQALDVADGVAHGQWLVAESMRGALIVDAYALGASGEVHRGSRRAFVDPEDRLQVQLSTGAESYAPGASAELSVTVLDQDGLGAVAAVGLAVVNEAVFALGGEPGGNVHTFFNVDDSVLNSGSRVLGRGITDLLAMPTSPEKDRLARLLFAKGGVLPAVGYEFNSVREEAPAVQAGLRGYVAKDAQVLVERLRDEVREGSVNRDDGARRLRSLARMTRDPFGKFYQTTVDEPRSGQFITTSAGPDEVWANADDVSVTSNYETAFWGDPVADGGWDVDDNCAVCGPEVQAGTVEREDSTNSTAATPGAPAAKVRKDFRETVFFNPTVITDANGHASVTVGLADSIATWRADAAASTMVGQLGAGRHTMRTFQSFFVDFDAPTVLTAGDEIELSAIVYNYLSEAASVTINLATDDAVVALEGNDRTLALGPSEVRSVSFRVLAQTAGEHAVTLSGTAGSVTDVMTRQVRVMPYGKPLVQTFSDKFNGTRTHTLNIPADAVEGGTHVEVTVTPGFAAEAVEGTEGMMKEPGGCFEQTTASAWPNTMVANYLEDTGQMNPELRERALGLVTRGYQRLLTFESPTGGYNWWGNADPGNRILSAIMLWHLKDMETLIETDIKVRERTLQWLGAQQETDGRWPSGDALHAGNEVLGTSDIRTTAFIVWALAHTGWADDAVAQGTRWLEQNLPPDDDLYACALSANALALTAPSGSAATQMFGRINTLKETREQGRVMWSNQAPSWTGAGGDVGAIETTGLVAYALLNAQTQAENAEGAMRFLVSSKDQIGTWYNTQATMNALRALSAAASPRGSEAEGTLSVSVNGEVVQTLDLTLDNGDLTQRVDITPWALAGDNNVTLDFAGVGEVNYRVTGEAYRSTSRLQSNASLGLTVDYGVSTGRVGEAVTATAVASNYDSGTRDQVIVRMGRAPGMSPSIEDLKALVDSGLVSRYEIRSDDVTFYLMGLAGGESRALSFGMTPTVVFDGTIPSSRVYAYYEPATKAVLDPVALTVLPAVGP